MSCCPHHVSLVGKKAWVSGISYGNVCLENTTRRPFTPPVLNADSSFAYIFRFFGGNVEHNTQSSRTGWESLLCCIAVCSPLTSKQSITVSQKAAGRLGGSVELHWIFSPQLHLKALLWHDEVCINTDGSVSALNPLIYLPLLNNY